MRSTKIIAKPGVQELYIIREFDAKRELVFKAFTDPQYLIQWLGPNDTEMKIDYFDARTGGSYRYVSSHNGAEYGFNGVIHELAPPERAIQTFEFEGLPERGHVSLDTATFKPLPGNRTELTIHSVYRSVADRDGIVRSGMERGLKDGFAKLDVLLTTM